MRTALIDADTLIYEAALGAERPVEWSEDLWTLHANMDDARDHFEGLVSEIKEATQAERLILALSDGDSTSRWRNTILPTYKMGRKRVRRPVVYGPLRDFCHATYETYQRPALEGDDVLGILLTHPTIVRGEKICVSLDKDLLGIPGEHYNYSTKVFRTVTEAEADYWFFMQALMGDKTDGYDGCPKIGPVTAAKILDPFMHDGMFDKDEAWKAIVKAYTKAGLGLEVALQNARVARILRAEDFDFPTKQVRVWTP